MRRLQGRAFFGFFLAIRPITPELFRQYNLTMIFGGRGGGVLTKLNQPGNLWRKNPTQEQFLRDYFYTEEQFLLTKTHPRPAQELFLRFAQEVRGTVKTVPFDLRGTVPLQLNPAPKKSLSRDLTSVPPKQFSVSLYNYVISDLTKRPEVIQGFQSGDIARRNSLASSKFDEFLKNNFISFVFKPNPYQKLLVRI